MKRSIVFAAGLLVAFGAAACSDDSGSSGNTDGSAGSAGSVDTAATGGSNSQQSGTGGSTDGSTTTAPDISDIPQDVALDTLTAEQQEALCLAANADAAAATAQLDSADITCAATGMTAAAMAMAMGGDQVTDEMLQQTCTAAFDSCVADAEANTDTTQTDTSDDCSDPMPDPCTATYEEVHTCLEDQIAQLNASIDAMPTCDEMTVEVLTGEATVVQPEESAACAAVNEKCPGLM